MDRMGLATCWFMKTVEREAGAVARGLRQRDPALLDYLIQQYQYRLFRYLLMLTGNRQEAEDLFQETWMRVLEKGRQYKPRWKFETWLFTIARHLAIDFLRRRQPQSLDALLQPPGTNQALELEDTTSSSAFEQAFQGEEAASVAAALAHLPSSCREVLTLRFHEDMELEEIARVVDSPLSTVKSRLYRGLEALRNLLEARKA
jgi:RNA polymerase sigma-70 factor (ECF subfamily)